jgi:hypothetical protein
MPSAAGVSDHPPIGFELATRRSSPSVLLTTEQQVAASYWHAQLPYSTRRFHFTLAQSGSYGTQNFSSLTYTAPPSTNPGAPPDPTIPQVNPVPASTTISILSEQTSASFSINWTRRWMSTVFGSYGISGGRNVDSQTLLPQTKTTTAGAILDYTLSRRDHLATTASVVFSNTSNGFEHRVSSGRGLVAQSAAT